MQQQEIIATHRETMVEKVAELEQEKPTHSESHALELSLQFSQTADPFLNDNEEHRSYKTAASEAGSGAESVSADIIESEGHGRLIGESKTSSFQLQCASETKSQEIA